MTDPISDLPRIRKLPDPADRALGLSRALDAIPDLQKQLREERRVAVNEMRHSGMTNAQVGERLGLHWARVSQISRGVSGGVKKKPQRSATDEPADA